MKKIIKLLILLSITSIVLYADKNQSIGTYCFESPYIFMDEKTKVKKVILHLEDSNRSREGGVPTRMFYLLEHDNRRYQVPNLLISYEKETNIYEGGGECDGGWLEFNATNNHLSMEDIRLSGLCGIITPPFGFEVKKVELDDSLEDIVKLSNVIYGRMGIGFLDENERIDYRKEKLWIKGKKCTRSENLKVGKIFYTEKEYIEMSKTDKSKDEYIYLFDEPLIEREELASKIEVIQLQKSYSNIVDMMDTEGFDFEWIKLYSISFFLHNNKRAFIRVGSSIPDGVQSSGFCGGYYLLELNQNILKKMSFAWECGSFMIPVEFKPILMATEGKENEI